MLRALCFLALSTSLFAATPLPESRHQQYLTFGLIAEEQTGFLLRDAGKSTGLLGGSIAMAEWDRLQLVFSATAMVNFRGKSNILDFATEAFDGRFGLFLDGEFTDRFRWSLGLVHYSGHIADSVLDPGLVPLNSDGNQVYARVIYDCPGHLRVGMTARPWITSDPGAKFLYLEQFAEWFPLGAGDKKNSGAPFAAVGLEEYGFRQMELSAHAQLGLLFGNHFQPGHQPSMRLAVGGYTGLDTRLKYAQILGNRVKFLYLGALFNL